MSCLLIGVDYRPQTSYFLGASFWPLSVFWILSYTLHFCLWHRILLASTTFYAVLSFLGNNGVEFNYYLYLALTINLICLLTALILYKRDGCYIKKVSPRDKEVSE